MNTPIPSIEAEGGIEVHIDNFFAARGLPHRYQDVLRVRNMRVGKRRLSMQRQADELDVTRTTLYNWYKLIDNITHAKDKRD
jgi:hypothetical protein